MTALLPTHHSHTEVLIMSNLSNSANHALNIAGRVQKFTQRRFKLRARTRFILIFFGSIAVVTSWFMPWFVVDYFLSPSAFQTAMNSHHYDAVSELSGYDQDIKLYGTNIAQIQYNGSDLVKDGYIKLDQKTIDVWLLLVGVTLLAVWVDEWQNRYRTVGLSTLRKFIIWINVLDLLGQVVLFLWYGVQATSRDLITHAANTMMVRDLGGTSNGLLHMTTGISVGQIVLALGILVTSIGVLTGDAPESIPGSSTSKWASTARFTAGTCLVIALLFFFFTYSLFL